jgi:hypothetical protein
VPYLATGSLIISTEVKDSNRMESIMEILTLMAALLLLVLPGMA